MAELKSKKGTTLTTAEVERLASEAEAGYVAHTPGAEMMPGGVEGAIASNEGGFSFFSDKRTEILEIFGDGDRTVSHVRMTGTNDGGIAWAGVPANGKPIDTDWIQISRHADDGTIVET